MGRSVGQVVARTTHIAFPYTGTDADLDHIADNVIPPVTADLISDTEAPEAGVASESKVETSQPIESKEQTPEADASAASESKVEFTLSAGVIDIFQSAKQNWRLSTTRVLPREYMAMAKIRSH